MERRIVHMDLDSFFVSVERLLNPQLANKAIIIGGSSDRGVVSSCSYEARKFGVHSAMPIKMAKQLCPDAIFIRGDMDNYSKFSNLVTQIIEEKSPLFEKASIDEHYIDISGMDKYVIQSEIWTHELRELIIRETGLPISFGLSTNKTVSKVATGEAKPNGEKQVKEGAEKIFLAPLSIKKIPGIGDKTYTILRNMGIEKVCTLQEMPKEMMQRAMGENGIHIWKKANGIDGSPVSPYHEQKSMSSETTFEKDTTDIQLLKKTLVLLIEDLAFQLRKSNRVSGCITLKLRYTDMQTHTFQQKISYTSSDHVLLEKINELFDKNYSRRVLIRLIGVKLSHLVSGFHQINLFEDTEEKIKLYQALDKIRIRFGDKAILRSIGLPDKKK